ncbi:LysR family transcriptional regulator [Bradyrhizobium manausense]
MERHLGARLLNRNTRGVGPSEDGHTHYQRCKRIISEIDDADDSVGLRRQELGGTLRLSTSLTFGRRVLALMLIEFMRPHPRIKVDLVCDDRFLDLVSHGIDVG